jgi:hypothetical protein
VTGDFWLSDFLELLRLHGVLGKVCTTAAEMTAGA